jgi:penicillin amidase
MHRLPVHHLLGGVPLIGGRYRFGDLPAPGSNDTIFKTAHSLAAKRHDTRYGTQSRHISDLSDPDANWFVLLGGQDGWFNSSTFADQVELFMTGELIQVPLTLDRVRDRFRHHMRLGR